MTRITCADLRDGGILPISRTYSGSIRPVQDMNYGKDVAAQPSAAVHVKLWRHATTRLAAKLRAMSGRADVGHGSFFDHKPD